MQQWQIPGGSRLALVSCLALHLATTAGAQFDDGSGAGVTLYRDADYQGVSETFYSDVPDLRGSRVGNDQTSSVSLGGDCQARLYADTDFTGPHLQIAFGVADLRGSRVGNDAVSSLEVRCEGSGWGNDAPWAGGRDGEWDGEEPRLGVTLYRDLDFSGTSQTFTDDVADLRGSFVGNDAVTSIRISWGCRARLHVHADFRGTYFELRQDTSDLRGSPVGNDSVTSVQVRCEGDERSWYGDDSSWDGDDPGHGVTLYRDLGFSGTSQTFADDVSDLRSSLVGNDSATSVRVSQDCRARLYVDWDFQGTYIEVDRDISDLRGSSIGNDSVTSLRVRCDESGGGWGGDGGDRVTLYQDTGFRGAAYSFDSDVGDLRSSFGANDKTSSVRVAPGCVVRLYQDPQFRGAYTETSGEISDLRSSRVGNDSVSSLRIRCR